MSIAVPQLRHMPFWYAPAQMYASIALRRAVFFKRVPVVEFMTVLKFRLVSQKWISYIFLQFKNGYIYIS